MTDDRNASTELAVVRTLAGDLRGRFGDGVYTFTGVRYGEDTSSQRFRTPIPVQPWQGIQDALSFGDQCIQPASPDFELLRSGWDQPTASSEDCLFLNIWTPAIGDQVRRPVMVNLHGGAWTVGNGNSSARSGETFARDHDVVRVNVNHRLGIFGFSYLVDLLGPNYADSGTVGILDVIESLRWVRDNIAAFGGDPANVTIFGVSGGGQKVSTLMAMPAAKGLFHRASVESGPMLTATVPESAADAAGRLLAALDIPRDKAHELLSLSGERLLGGYMKMYPDGGLTSSGLGPVVDGVNLPRHPFEPTAPEISSDVPLLIGTTATETSIFSEFLGGSTAGLTWEALEQRLERLLPSGLPMGTTEIIDCARRSMPDAAPADVLFAVTTELLFRSRSIVQAERAAQRRAPVYMWLIEWNTPVDGGKWGAPHGLSVPLVMDTVTSVVSMFGEDLTEPLALSWKMSSAWAEFARTGVPGMPDLPRWTAFDTERRETMIFDTACRIVADPRSDLRRMFRR